MSHKLGVLIVHGMGSAEVDFAEPMIDELQELLSDEGFHPDDIVFKPAHWADVLDGKEYGLWRKLSRNTDMDLVKYRQFILSAFGDAIAYQRVPFQHKDVYTLVHERILMHLQDLRKELRDGLSNQEKERPFVVLAHSLGGYIMSNYIWDRQKGYDVPLYGGNEFLEMKTLTSIITFGCNIPLFTLAYDNIEAITFPSPDVHNYFPGGTSPKKLKEVTKWLNFYDPDDILGYPLKPLSESYRKSVSEDITINAGSVFTSWNPLSHMAYDTDDDFTEPVATLLGNILRLL